MGFGQLHGFDWTVFVCALRFRMTMQIMAHDAFEGYFTFGTQVSRDELNAAR